MAGKKKSKGKKSSSSHKAPAAAPAHKGKSKKRRSSGGKKRGGGKRRSGGGGFFASLKGMFSKKGSSKKRRSSGGKKRGGHSRRSSGGGGMTLKQFAINGLKLGAMATAGWIAGEALRSYLLKPKKDGSASTLAAFEQRHLASPVFTAAITAIPGVVGGLIAYWAGKKWKQPMLQTAGGALMIGGVVSGGGRIILGNRWVAEKTDGLQLVRGGAPQQQIAPAAPAPALPAGPTPNAGYGDAFVGNPYGYTQPPAYKQLGDAFVGNPYGDAFVGDPGGEYLSRTGQAPRSVAGYGTTAAAELDG